MQEPTLDIIRHGSDLYWEATKLREEILRAPLGLAYTREELLAEADSYHLAAYIGQELVACLILVPIDPDTIKLRQMAVKKSWQGHQIGSRLVAYAEDVAREKEHQRIELHARLVAKPFYDKLQYETIGDEFAEVGIPHFRMEKAINTQKSTPH